MSEQEYYDTYGHPPRGAILAANIFAKALDTIGSGIDFIADQFKADRADFKDQAESESSK